MTYSWYGAVRTDKFEVPDDYWDAIRKCLKRNTRFLTIPFGYDCPGVGQTHPNYLIYDTTTKEMERFEPNGGSFKSCYDSSNHGWNGIDYMIKELFNTNIPGMVKTAIHPLEYCPVALYKNEKHLIPAPLNRSRWLVCCVVNLLCGYTPAKSKQNEKTSYNNDL